jgi:hypothetical protein
MTSQHSNLIIENQITIISALILLLPDNHPAIKHLKSQIRRNGTIMQDQRFILTTTDE